MTARFWHGLTNRQQSFVQALVRQTLEGENLQPSKAYREAFDCPNASKQSIANRACKLWAKPEIKQRYEDILDAEAAHAGVTYKDIFVRIMRIADDDQARNADKLRALELAGKSIGMFADGQNSDEPKMTEEEAAERFKRALARLRELEARDNKVIPLQVVDDTEHKSA